MRELRATLGDDAGAPRFIATVHRRGYRFIAEVHGEPTSSESSRGAGGEALASALIGRDDELDEMHRLFDRARAGQRQILFVSGDAGIGKTALVDTFVASLPAATRIARGQCLEHYGSGEAYLPLLAALGELARGPRAAPVAAALRRHAPSWLAQLPSLIEAADRDVLQRELLGLTRERMLREMSAAIEVLAAEEVLVLVLEDAHWSDPSTVDALSQIAHGRSPARLLVVATYRPIDAILSSHPIRMLTQRLGQQRLCTELRLPLFGRDQIAGALAHGRGTERTDRHLPRSHGGDAAVRRRAGRPHDRSRLAGRRRRRLPADGFAVADLGRDPGRRPADDRAADRESAPSGTGRSGRGERRR